MTSTRAMASTDNDNMKDYDYTQSEQDKKRGGVAKYTARRIPAVPEYTKKPIFVKKERVPLSFANRKRRTAFNPQGTQNQETGEQQRGVSSESGESTQERELQDEVPPGSSVRPPPVAGNWLSGKGQRMGLGEAFARADEGATGHFRPRLATGGRVASLSSAEAGAGETYEDNGGFRPRAARRVASASIAETESRIPRSTAYSPGSSQIKSSPPKSLKDAYARAEREEQAKIEARLGEERAEQERADRELTEREVRAEQERIEGEQRLAEALGPVEYESESTGPRPTSPSPAARPIRRPPHLQHGRPGSSRSTSSGSMGGHWSDNYPLPDAAKLAEWDANAERNRMRKERADRIRANSKPIYLGGRDNGEASRIAQAKDLLERKAAGEDVTESLPRWGAKSRKTEAWMRRILNPNDPLLPLYDDVNTKSKDSDADTADADIPRGSIEVGPSAQPTPPSSRPSSAAPSNASPEKSKMWEADIDFTAHSLQASDSPVLRVKTSRLDDLHQRELQSLTARAVATNRLEEIRERNSEERSILSESSRTHGRDITPAPSKEPQEEVYHERTILEEEGEHIPNTPITIFTKGNYRPSSSGSESEKDPEKLREDSHEAIRLLARRMSPGPQKAERLMGELNEAEESRDDQKKESGSRVPQKPEGAEKTKESAVEKEMEEKPANAEEKKTEARSAKVEERPTKSSDRLEVKETQKTAEERKNQFKRGGLVDEVKRRSATSTPPKSDVDPEERISAEARLFELADTKSEQNSVRAPSRSPSPSDDGKYDETPRPKADPLSLPTPKVTGAFIETPAPSMRKPRKSRSISPTYEMVSEVNDFATSSNTQPRSRTDPAARAEEREQKSRSTSSSQRDITKQSQIRTSRPRLINTATPASVADDLRNIAMEEQYEDSTLDDFDAVLGNAATTDLDNTTIIEPVFDLEYDDRGRPLSTEEKSRRLERLRLERMNQQLKNTSSSIRDARHGIERLEHQITSTVTATPVLDEGMYITVNLKIPVPRLIVPAPATQNRGRLGETWRRNWRFTWFGLIVFVFGLWYVSESAMCSAFCHPKHSTRNSWHPSDPFFPWAIPTKLNQWTGNVVGNILEPVGQWLDFGRGANTGYMSANDWWEGRGGPVGIVYDTGGSIFDDDELV